MAFDLSDVDAQAAAERGRGIQIKDPRDATGETLLMVDGEPFTIYIVGSDSKKVKAKVHQTLDKAYEAARKGKGSSSAADAEKEVADTLAAATTHWTPVLPLDGQPFPCTEQNARKLYSDPRFPFIAEQLAKEVENRAAFFAAGSTN